MNSSNEKITFIQATVVLTMTIIGVGIVTLPRVSAEEVQTPDIWISMILGGGISIVVAFFITKLCLQFKGMTIYQFSPILVGKWAGFVFNLFIIMYFILVAGYQARSMAEVLRAYLLDKTPIEVVIIVYIAVGVYIVISGIYSIVKLLQIYFPVVLVFILLMLALSITNVDFNNLRPVLGGGFIPVLKGIKPTTLSLAGIESYLILMAYMHQSKKAMKAAAVGIFIALFLYILIVIAVIGALTVDEVRLLTWPTLELVKSIEMKVLLLERFESFFIILWVITTFTSFIMNFHFASLGLSQVFKKAYKPFVYGLIPFVYLCAMYPEDINGVFKLGGYIGNMAIVVAGIIPILLLIIAFIRRKRNAKN
ncbi:spore germination protein [Aeromicrobium ponti]|uniref:Spore germination protein n=1 Tax=Cytobacillus oceanisediminis TaxID=665099 RepID=A0A562K3G0_9BACI|nr:GerAB/ArcD/ProY family transporter [Cytobacillus oceanisediminis]TWH89958.1 spore germination protein [Cytobacillus oceanisediminis]